MSYGCFTVKLKYHVMNLCVVYIYKAYQDKRKLHRDLNANSYSPALKKWGLYWICLVLPEFCGSVILSLCHSVIIQMKLEYLWGQVANVDQILYEASLGWGKGCIRFWDRLDHGHRKRPLTYNRENDFSTFSRLFLIQFFLYLQVTRT